MSQTTTEGQPTNAERAITEVLADAEDGLGFADLLAASSLPKTTFRRTLKGLRERLRIEKREGRYYLRPVEEGPQEEGPGEQELVEAEIDLLEEERDQEEIPEEPPRDLGPEIEAAREALEEARARYERELDLLEEIDSAIGAARIATEEARQRAEEAFAATGIDSDTSELLEAEKRLEDLSRKKLWQERIEVAAGIAADEAETRLLEAELAQLRARWQRLEAAALEARDRAIAVGNEANEVDARRRDLRSAQRRKERYLEQLRDPEAAGAAGVMVRRNARGGFFIG